MCLRIGNVGWTRFRVSRQHKKIIASVYKLFSAYFLNTFTRSFPAIIKLHDMALFIPNVHPSLACLPEQPLYTLTNTILMARHTCRSPA
jgi:hypothetical protein